MQHPARTLHRQAYLDNIVAKASPTNREGIQRYLISKRAEGLKLNSLVNIAVASRNVDKYAGGRPIRTLAADDLVRVLEEFTKTHSPATCTGTAGQVRAYYRWLNPHRLFRPHTLDLSELRMRQYQGRHRYGEIRKPRRPSWGSGEEAVVKPFQVSEIERQSAHLFGESLRRTL